MKISRYLPSGQFIAIAAALFISAGLVYAADYTTRSAQTTASIQSDQTAATSDSTDWQAALYAEQAANASTSIVAPSQDLVNKFLTAAKSSNVTDTVARTMLINLTNAKAQGLGDDIPTQDQIVSSAVAQVNAGRTSAKTYSSSDLTIVNPSPAALRTYGNAVMQALAKHPAASEQATLLAIDYIVEGGDKTQAQKLATIGAAYQADAEDLAAIPVPQTLAPLHLSIINNLEAVSATYDDIETVGTDSVRGLAGLQSYETLMDSGARLFTNVAQILNKDGILFSKDEPGSAWNTLLGGSTGS